MRNCIILGSGRSGTSMVAGCLAAAGYFMGDNLYPPRGSNPKGFFEGPQINSINEALLAQVVPADQHLRYGQRWLVELPTDCQFSITPEIDQAIVHMVGRKPYCFKDPRFSYTLPLWANYVRNAIYICVFREPGITAESIVKECAEASYLSNVCMTYPRALNIWTAIYRSVLSFQKLSGELLFLHYSQVVNGEGLDKIAQRLEAPIDRTFPDAALRRSQSISPVPSETLSLYGELCRLSGYSGYENQNQTRLWQ